MKIVYVYAETIEQARAACASLSLKPAKRETTYLPKIYARDCSLKGIAEISLSQKMPELEEKAKDAGCKVTIRKIAPVVQNSTIDEDASE